MAEQLTRQSESIRKIIRYIEDQLRELEICIMKEPTGYPREEMTNANIMIVKAINEHLKEIV